MSWLLHNVIADMYGPYFLAFYAVVIGVVIVGCYRSVRSVDRTGDFEPPPLPAKIDPYEIAYLRGGENEVTRVALASLIQRGLLKITDTRKFLAKMKTLERARKPEAKFSDSARSHFSAQWHPNLYQGELRRLRGVSPRE